MTEPEPRPGREGPRRRTLVGVCLVAVVALAIGLAIALGGGSAGSATPSATPGVGASESPALGDLPLVTVAPVASVPDAGPSAAPPSPSQALAAGIRANHIRIVRLGIDLVIVEGDGIDAPIGKAAHYPGSAWPGGGSNIYIYGHARVGMFLPLWQIRLGDIVELVLVDGTTRTYVVTEILPKVPFDAVQYLQPTPTEQLTLQTSTSYYATAPKFVVITVPKT